MEPTVHHRLIFTSKPPALAQQGAEKQEADGVLSHLGREEMVRFCTPWLGRTQQCLHRWRGGIRLLLRILIDMGK